MRVPGFCTSCRRYTNVSVGSHGLIQTQMGRLANGTCSPCQQREDDERTAKYQAARQRAAANWRNRRGQP